MKLKSKWLATPALFTLLFTSLTVFAAEPPHIAQPDASCAKTSDPNEAPYKFTALSKKYAGQCINSEKFRSIVNLTNQNGAVTFNNFQHENQFWQASLNVTPENIEAVYLQIVRFPIAGVVEAGHGQLRFKLKEPVRLVNQADSRASTAADIVVSFEASFPVGAAYNFALGAIDNFGLLARVVSTAQKKLDSPVNPFEQYELDLSAAERSQLLANALTRGFSMGQKYAYNTLRPNCVSEAFDLIDALDRLKGKYPQFLTVISNDPVAAPAIAGLQQRGILKNRVQDYDDEMRGVTKTIPVVNSRSIPMVPQVSGQPWTLVVTMPNLDSLTPAERQAILRVRQQVLSQAPVVLQGLGSAMMTEAGGEGTALITGALKMLQTNLVAILRESNSALPNSPQQMGLYLVPFTVSSAITRLDGLGVPAALPFAVVDAVVDETVPRSQEIYFAVAEGARKAGDAGARGNDPGYFMASAVRMNLQRNNVQIRSQLMAGLNNQTKPFTMSNSQVVFHESVISGAANRSTRPVILITHAQTDLNRVNPSVSIEFGPEGGLAGTIAGAGFGVFQINKDFDGSCDTQAASAPTLNGQLAASALGKPLLDRLLRGKKVAFQVLSAQLDAQTLNISQMDVRVSTWPLSCISNDVVNNQFRENANQMLDRWKAEARSGDLLQKLIGGSVRR